MSDSTEVSYFAIGLRLEKGKASAKPLTDGEIAIMRAAFSALAEANPNAASSAIHDRIILAEKAIKATLPEERRETFKLEHQPADVVSGLPYIGRIDDLCPEAALQIINDYNRGAD